MDYCTFSGDVESNPGPFWKKGDDPIENLQNIIDDQADDIKDLRDTIDNQNDVIDELKNKINEVTSRLSELSEDENKTKENTEKCERMIQSLQKDSDRNFETFSENDSKFGRELLQQKVNFSPKQNIPLSCRKPCFFLIQSASKCQG